MEKRMACLKAGMSLAQAYDAVWPDGTSAINKKSIAQAKAGWPDILKRIIPKVADGDVWQTYYLVMVASLPNNLTAISISKHKEVLAKMGFAVVQGLYIGEQLKKSKCIQFCQDEEDDPLLKPIAFLKECPDDQDDGGRGPCEMHQRVHVSM
mmetsp:Transcript_106707/g.282957  ORF Transcript_106707/g.282957 Transcript_106707/m.282957 type:complete len:152 (+) Transcript_106707:3-458(+)